jgi:hypothetical protein
MDLMFEILTNNNLNSLSKKFELLDNDIQLKSEKLIDLKEKYLYNVLNSKIQYQSDIDNYINNYKSKTKLLDKVKIQPPIKPSKQYDFPILSSHLKYENLDVFTYDTYQFQFKQEEESNIEILKGSYVDFAEKYYIINPCNVTGRIPKGLTKEIFDKYPDADIYTNKTKRKLGDIFIIQNIINIVTQISPLNPKEPNDTEEIRLKAYEDCLDKIGNKLKHATIVFKMISKKHYEIIEKFSKKYSSIKVYVS